MFKPFEGKVALVTGATSGIGKAIAQHYGELGASVMISGRNETNGWQLVKEIRDNGGNATFCKTDIRSPEQCRALVQTTVKMFGRLDIACNNAGISGPITTVADYPVEAWQQVLDTNLNSIFYCVKYELEAMLRQNTGGNIVNMTSVLGQTGNGHLSAYVAAKHGIIGLTKSAALEVATTGIRINAVGPSYIDTPMLDVHPELSDVFNRAQPVGRMGTATEVSELVMWLSSDKASFVTGSFYPVDGGYLARSGAY